MIRSHMVSPHRVMAHKHLTAGLAAGMLAFGAAVASSATAAAEEPPPPAPAPPRVSCHLRGRCRISYPPEEWRRVRATTSC
jgi:hypothetical protein